MRPIHDPSINRVAAQEADQMIREINRIYGDGKSCFYGTRERVMAANGTRIAQAYGQATAKKALMLVQAHGPAAVPKEHMSRLRLNTLNDWLEARKKIDGHTWGYSDWEWSFYNIFGFMLRQPRIIKHREGPYVSLFDRCLAEAERRNEEDSIAWHAEQKAEAEAKKAARERQSLMRLGERLAREAAGEAPQKRSYSPRRARR